MTRRKHRMAVASATAAVFSRVLSPEDTARIAKARSQDFPNNFRTRPNMGMNENLCTSCIPVLHRRLNETRLQVATLTPFKASGGYRTVAPSWLPQQLPCAATCRWELQSRRLVSGHRQSCVTHEEQ